MLIQKRVTSVQSNFKGVNIPYNPDYADENYSFEYGGYVDSKRRGFGERGRRFGGRQPIGYGGRYVSALFVNFSLVKSNINFRLVHGVACRLSPTLNLSKTGQAIKIGFTMFSPRMSVWQQSILWVSSVIVTRSGAFGLHNIFLWKLLQRMFSFHWISILLITVTAYTYLANIFFHVT